MKECMQFKCAFHPDNDSIPKGVGKQLMTTQCPVCDVCKAEPHMIDEHCENCLICENKEGFIRRGQPKPLLEITVRESNVIDIEDIKVNENIIKNEGVNKNDRHTRIN